MTENTMAEKASTTLATMLDYLGLNAVVKAEEKNGKIVLVTYSEEAGRIIGKKGQSLQSLELLVNRMAMKENNDSPWINIDVDGYSSGRSGGRRDGYKKDFRRGDKEDRGDRGDRRQSYNRKDNRGAGRRDGGKREYMSEEQLEQMALDAAKEAKRWGDAVTLAPMNAHDRRIIHVTLKQDGEIDTQSKSVEGSDKLKRVVVCLNEKK
jgi:spoIIIJ-associated protein